MSESYVKIDCTLARNPTEKAVCIDVGGDQHWIPRSCIHGADERRLDDLAVGDEIELQVFEWIAAKEGLI